jgi:hypothetical protein
LVVLRPELRPYLNQYGRVLIVDATHGISVTGFKLFTIVVVDSLFKSILVAYAFIRSESFDNLDFIAEELGIQQDKITVISDDNEATKLLASTHGWLHLLCQWHYAACYIRTLKSKGVRHSDAASFNATFFDLLQSTRFDSPEDHARQLGFFVDAFSQLYPAMKTWLEAFVVDAPIVCEYHRRGVFTAGAHTTQRSESLHSFIKMGNLYANILREMSFFKAYLYLKDVVDIMLEKSLDELSNLLQTGHHCCSHVSNLIRDASQNCTEVCIGTGGWTSKVVTEAELRAADVVDNNLLATSLNGASFYCVTSAHARSGQLDHVVEHWVVLHPHQKQAVWCSCHEFSCTGVTCVGIAAAIKQGRGNPADVQWLNERWSLSFHPLFAKAVQRNCPAADADIAAEAAASEAPEEEETVGMAPTSDTDDCIISRWRRIQAIHLPNTNAIRRSTLNDAWSALRDEFSVHCDPAKYRACMASILDLRANFSGTPGCWIQAPSRGGDCRSSGAWTSTGILAPAPRNLANNKRYSDLTVGQRNKMTKHNQLRTAQDRRESQGDWTLYLPSNAKTQAFWTCPVPGCMTKLCLIRDKLGFIRHRPGLSTAGSGPVRTVTVTRVQQQRRQQQQQPSAAAHGHPRTANTGAGESPPKVDFEPYDTGLRYQS